MFISFPVIYEYGSVGDNHIIVIVGSGDINLSHVSSTDDLGTTVQLDLITHVNDILIFFPVSVIVPTLYFVVVFSEENSLADASIRGHSAKGKSTNTITIILS